ncbi:MAG: glycosyltransferase [Acidimicrobiia bacterium]
MLVLIDSLGAGGAEYSMVQLAPVLSLSGVSLTFVCLERRAVGPGAEHVDGDLDVRYLSGSSWMERFSQLRTILARERPDLVHTTLFASDLLGRIAGATMRVPVVTSLVNVSYERVRLGDPYVRRWRLRALQAIDAVTALSLTSAFHAISHTVADSAVRHLRIDPQKVTVIPRSRDRSEMDVAAVRAAVREKLGLPGHAQVIINVGRQEYQKGQSTLIEAYSRLAESRADLYLIVAGREGHASSELQSLLAKSSSADRILLLGHRTDIPDLLSASDVFAFPSLYEGLGGALLEAMALGMPIVASAIDAVKEVAADSVMYATPGDAIDLAARLAEVLDDKSRRLSLEHAAWRRFEEWPTPSEVATRMAEWYRTAISR